MSIISHYIDPAEIQYIKQQIYHTPYFAPGELTKIEHYAEALADNFSGWVIHHRLELNDDCSINMYRDDLIVANLYYSRPADELVFLRSDEHTKMHANSHSLGLARTTSSTTKEKQSMAKIKANNTEHRYAVVSDMVQRGETLSFTDYQFYRRYCARNGLEFTGAKVDKTGTIGRVDVPKVPSDKQNKPRRIDQTNQRYADVIARLEAGESLPMKEYSFLRRYCARYGKDFPNLHITPASIRLQSSDPDAPVPPVGL